MRILAFHCCGLGFSSIPEWGTKILQATQHSQKINQIKWKDVPKSVKSGYFLKNIIINVILLLLRITQVSNCCPTHKESINFDYFCVMTLGIRRHRSVQCTWGQRSVYLRTIPVQKEPLNLASLKKHNSWDSSVFFPNMKCEKVTVK